MPATASVFVNNFCSAHSSLSTVIADIFPQIPHMEIRFIKAIQFTRLIKAGGRLREFNFRRAKAADQVYFSVNVVDDRGDRILFQMIQEQDRWRLNAQQLPVWVEQQETRLSEAIEEELRDQ